MSKYVYLEADNETSKNLFELQKTLYGQEIENSYPFHITLFVSKNEIKLKNLEKQIKPISFNKFALSKIGVENQFDCLLVKSQKLVNFRNSLIDQYNVIPTFEDFIPHITLNYNTEIQLKNYDINNLRLSFDKIVVKDNLFVNEGQTFKSWFLQNG